MDPRRPAPEGRKAAPDQAAGTGRLPGAAQDLRALLARELAHHPLGGAVLETAQTTGARLDDLSALAQVIARLDSTAGGPRPDPALVLLLSQALQVLALPVGASSAASGLENP